MKKTISMLLSIVMTAALFTSCSKAADDKQVVEKTEVKMDTTISLKAYGKGSKEAIDEAMKRIDEIDQIASPNYESSDVYKINAAAGKSYVKVHPETMKMIKKSMEYSKLSDGAWDITVGPLIKLWGIGTSAERVPSDAEIKAALPLVGYKNISINETDNSIKLEKEGMSIDLGGIAKGFAVDELVKIFNKHKVPNALINLGGSSIYTIGKNTSGLDWSIGIQHPRAERNQALLGIVRVSGQSVGTSGDYERYFIVDGKRYHHILNPATGYPTDNGSMSDTIIIDGSVPDSGMISDILTTTVFVLGHEKGLKLIESLPKTACEITTTDNKIYPSSQFKDRLQNLDPQFEIVK